MLRLTLVVLLLACHLTSFASTNTPPKSFSAAKKRLIQLYHNEYAERSFYCNCSYAEQKLNGKKKLLVNHQSCAYTPRKNPTRAARIEWEHVVSAWEFGHQLQCWQTGGRKSCRKDPVFKAMEADVFNLVPAIGEVNGDRSNFGFGMISGEARAYGACDIEIAFKKRRAEPRPDIRGDIARSYFYMEKQYGLKISKKNRQLYNAWAKQDPVSEQELRIARAKAKLMGWDNSFIELPTTVARNSPLK